MTKNIIKFQTITVSPRMAEENWQDVLQEALHAMRSLLCTATNETPHERMFHFQWRATYGTAMPTWLLTEGPVLLHHVRNKRDQLCDEVLLLEANPWYAHIQHINGREDTVTTSDLAPCSNEGIQLENAQVILAVEVEVPTNINPRKYRQLMLISTNCCNLSVGVALNVWFTTNGMCAKNNTHIYLWREQAIIEWLWHVISIVACRHSLKLCALAARAFRSQQNQWTTLNMI